MKLKDQRFERPDDFDLQEAPVQNVRCLPGRRRSMRQDPLPADRGAVRWGVYLASKPEARPATGRQRGRRVHGRWRRGDQAVDQVGLLESMHRFLSRRSSGRDRRRVEGGIGPGRGSRSESGPHRTAGQVPLQDSSSEVKEMNQIMVIKPYRHAETWVFDDEAVGLDKAPFLRNPRDDQLPDTRHSQRPRWVSDVALAQPFPASRRSLPGCVRNGRERVFVQDVAGRRLALPSPVQILRPGDCRDLLQSRAVGEMKGTSR